jgi:TRAP-type C4-dicarboxylate transport system substrate-binding protein
MMFSKRFLFLLLLSTTILALAACQARQKNVETAPTEAAASTAATVSGPEATAVPPTEAAAAGETGLTLRLAIPDAGDQERSFILEFADQVEALSGGEMAVEILWDAGADTEEGYEHGVLAGVLDGDYELGMAASRSFEYEGITTFQPLQTPFLIDNEALAVAVARSDVAAEMLDALSSSGPAGLTLWPEELRHPLSIIPGEPALSPDDLAGQTVRTTKGVAAALMEALGGTPDWNEGDYQIAESGLRSATSLSGRHMGTADVTFFTKYQVLFGNGEVFDGLSAEQQAVLRKAAAAAQAKSLAERPADDVALGAAFCRHGGTVVLAGEEQVAAFKEAGQPVVEMITADPANAEAVAALRELKENTEPSAGAEACAPAAQADPSAYANGVLNGTWGYMASEEEAAFFQDAYRVTADEVRLQVGFDNEEWWEAPAFDGATFLENGVPEGDGGMFHIEDDRLITIGAGGWAQITFEWSLDGDQLTLVAVEECNITSGGLQCRDDRSQMDRIMMMVMEHTYTKSSDSPRPWEE